MDWLFVYLAVGLVFVACRLHIANDYTAELPPPIIALGFVIIAVLWPVPVIGGIMHGVYRTLNETFWP